MAEMNPEFDEHGWLNSARPIASPNFDDRPADMPTALLIVHNISLPPGEFGGNGVIELFTNRLDPAVHPYYESIKDLRVSAHFFIRRDGTLIQFVSADKRAWHAGISSWNGRERCNDFSIGIELEGTDETPFTEAQYTCLNDLIEVLLERYPIKDIVGHSDIAPGRKTDPGLCFDWERVRRPEPESPTQYV
jgi:AmpD protein